MMKYKNMIHMNTGDQYVMSLHSLIKLWDLRKTHGGSRREPQCHSILEHTGTSSHHGFTSMSLSPQEDIVYASCMDNTIYAYHLTKPTPKPGVFCTNASLCCILVLCGGGVVYSFPPSLSVHFPFYLVHMYFFIFFIHRLNICTKYIY